MKISDQIDVVPGNLDGEVIKLNDAHLMTLKDLDEALTTALGTLKTDSSGMKYVIFKDLQNEDKDWYLVYDLITHAINNEEMDDEYFTKRASGMYVYNFSYVVKRYIYFYNSFFY